MANASGNGSLTGRRGVQPAATGPAGGGGHPAISRNMGMGNVNALVGVVLALAASRRRQTPHVAPTCAKPTALSRRSEEHTSELQSLMRNSYAVFCLKKKKNQ